MPKVVLGRVNRRVVSDNISLRSFEEDVRALVARERLFAEAAGKRWAATDLHIDPSQNFATGVLGYVDRESLYVPDDERFSWLKAETYTVTGGTSQTVVPFALDLRPVRRWIGFVTTAKVRARTFEHALNAVLASAVSDLSLVPADWTIDPVTSPDTVIEWLSEHPSVDKLVRVAKFPNPQRDFDEERRRMRTLNAEKKTETYQPHRGQDLRLTGDVFDELLQGIDEGFVEIRITSREGAGHAEFSTTQKSDYLTIPTYGGELSLGVDYVLAAVRSYSEKRADEANVQGTLDE